MMEGKGWIYIGLCVFSAVMATGCASPLITSPAGDFWNPDEQGRVSADRDDFDVVTRDSDGSHVLRMRARPVPDDLDLTDVAARMEKTMHDTGGVGIAAPQVGLSVRLAILMVDGKTDDPRILAVRNPSIVERSDRSELGYEGCLSIPDKGGLVRRNQWIRVKYSTLEGERRSESYEGFNAVLWQHELDHLDGILYVDRLVGDLLPWEEVKRLRMKMESGK